MNLNEEIWPSTASGSTGTLLIREATLHDIPIIIAQRRQMYTDMGYPTDVRMDELEDRFALWVHDRLEDGRYHNWLAWTADGRVAAGAGLWLVEWPPQMMDFSPYRGYIMNVYTHPMYRGCGLARQLVQAALDWCADHAIHTISLHASEQGRSVYEGLGFGPTNEMRLHMG